MALLLSFALGAIAQAGEVTGYITAAEYNRITGNTHPCPSWNGVDNVPIRYPEGTVPPANMAGHYPPQWNSTVSAARGAMAAVHASAAAAS